MRSWQRIVFGLMLIGLGVLISHCTAGCSRAKPQRGGRQSTVLGGATEPTTTTLVGPENPQTPSTQTLEKTTVSEYDLPHNTQVTDGSQGDSAREQPETSPRGESAPVESRVAAVTVQGASPSPNKVRRSAADSAGILRRQTVYQKSMVQIGTAQKDTSRDLTAKLAAVKPVIWIGALMIPIGLLVGYYTAKKGWLINGIIIGAAIAGSGAAMIAIALWLPDINPLLGLLGLGGAFTALLVYLAYVKSQHDALAENTPPAPGSK